MILKMLFEFYGYQNRKKETFCTNSALYSDFKKIFHKCLKIIMFLSGKKVQRFYSLPILRFENFLQIIVFCFYL